MSWSKFSPAELERRRRASVEALKDKEREAWEKSYQEMCDRDYWTLGQCCAGCDHWSSEMGNVGQCLAAGIVSGTDVMLSLGIDQSTYAFKPGPPYTRGYDHCGLFKDDFDWASLDTGYLERIGAMGDGKVKDKPSHVRECKR